MDSTPVWRCYDRPLQSSLSAKDSKQLKAVVDCVGIYVDGRQLNGTVALSKFTTRTMLLLVLQCLQSLPTYWSSSDYFTCLSVCIACVLIVNWARSMNNRLQKDPSKRRCTDRTLSATVPLSLATLPDSISPESFHFFQFTTL